MRGARKVRLEQSIPAGMFAQRYSNENTHFDKVYDIRIVGRDRVAGRAAYKVAISPRDPYRYGHMLYIDEQSSLLLKSVIYDQKVGFWSASSSQICRLVKRSVRQIYNRPPVTT